MSGAITGGLGLAALVGVETVLLRPPRMIGAIIPDCTLEERHTDRLQVTQHPVELGANISDHAFMLPFELSLRYGFSNSTFFDPIYVQTIYQLLRGLQQTRIPFDIITGKRVYDSMLLLEISTSTDARTEDALMVELHCQQVLIVSTSVAVIGPTAAQQSPEQTAGTLQTGQQQALPAGSPNISGLNVPGGGGLG
jgi:hypothetical protein